jgi:hypothetical protein
VQDANPLWHHFLCGGDGWYWAIIGFLSEGWAIAVGLALVVIVSFAHAGTLAPESPIPAIEINHPPML